MPNPLKFVPMILAQQMGRQELERREEPKALTDETDNVLQYNTVMTTKLVIAYAIAMEAVYRARSEHSQSKAIDLACGPGHYTLCLRKYLRYDDVTGVDLAPNMVEVAQRNSREQKLDDHVRFELGNITKLKQFADNSVDLASFTDAAHHMPDLATVGAILVEMERVTKPAGLVMLMDLARLRTSKLTETYVNFLAWDYIARGLPNFFDDFRNSMYAAWTYQELKTTIPKNSRRVWCHLVSKALPTVQIVLGLPVGRKKHFVRAGVPWDRDNGPVPKNMQLEWTFARLTLFSARPNFISPAGSG
jgi:ubiquinone/menaquinone biosynthesis C-methylase UbiE